MNNVALKRWLLIGGLLMTGLVTGLSPSAMGADLRAENPKMGDSLAAMGFEAEAPAKRTKLEESLKEASKAYQTANFEKAVTWYESAQALNAPSIQPQLKQALANARTMQAAQRAALAELPLDAKQRSAQLAQAMQSADQFYQAKQFQKAYEAYTKIWLTSGDFQGKTLRLMARCEDFMPDKTIEATQVGAPIAAAGAARAEAARNALPAEVMLPIPGSPAAPAPKMIASAAPEAMASAAAPAPFPQGTPSLDAAPSSTAPINVAQMDAQQRAQQANAILARADALLKAGNPTAAIESYKQVIQIDPHNLQAINGISNAEQARNAASGVQRKSNYADTQRQIDEMHSRAVAYYDKQEIVKARDLWQQILQIQPGNKLAQTWLDKTEADLQRVQNDEKLRAAATATEAQREKLLSSPISIDTKDQKIPLSTFMYNLSLTTQVEMQYSVTEGADAKVQVNFVDKPLREVLDKVLNEIGLTWSIDDKNVITVKANLVTRSFNLSPDQMSKVRGLYDSGQLQRLVWGQTDPPSKGCEITIDERSNVLSLTGSKLHIQKMDDYLKTLSNVEAPDLVMHTYKIREADGPKIKALIQNIISSTSNESGPFDLERKVFVDKDDLIVRDTPQNVQKIEDLLLDKKFIENITNQKLDIVNYSLVPKEIGNISNDQVEAFTSRVVEAIKYFLYAKDGESNAAKEGRRTWYDKATLQLTVVDTPDNLDRVGQYIDSLPEISRGSLQKVIFLQNAVAENLAASLSNILNLTTGNGTSAAGGAGATERVFRMNRGDEVTFRDIRIRLIRVQPNNIQDIHDDSAQFDVITPTGVNQLTLQELQTQPLQDYLFTGDQIRATGGGGQNGQVSSGLGSATIRVQYQPVNAGAALAVAAPSAAQLAAEQNAAVEQQGISINPFTELNALIIRYTNPTLYSDAIKLVDLLDKPTKQVAIETKFVEVNEQRAKEASADLSVAGLGQGRSIDTSAQTVNARYAQDIDEFRNAFEPPIENPLASNLIKGTTVIDAVIGNFPNISYSLHLLEAEGIVNVVNGPKVLALDNQQAQFRIEGFASTAAAAATNANTTSNIVNALGNGGNLNIPLSDPGQSTGAGGANLINAVVLDVTPQITSEKSIILNPLRAEILDFDFSAGSIVTPITNAPTQGTNPPVVDTPVIPGSAITNYPLSQFVKHRYLETQARITNGGTIIVGGWTGERNAEFSSGIPILRDMPFIGKLFFNRQQRSRDRTTLLIFLSASLID